MYQSRLKFRAVLFITFAVCSQMSLANITNIFEYEEDSKKEQRIDLIAELIKSNFKTNGWQNFMCVGKLPDTFYAKVRQLPVTFWMTDPEAENHDMEIDLPYPPNTVVIETKSLYEMQNALGETLHSPYWNPLANVFLYYHDTATEELSRIFFIFWFYAMSNAVVVQYDDSKELLYLSHYSQYISENYELQNVYGCWKTTKLGIPITRYNESFVCEKGCHNVTVHSKRKQLHLGTCIGYNTYAVRYGDYESLHKLNLFEDKSVNLHGFPLRAAVIETMPFVQVTVHSNGTCTAGSRDGNIWNTFSELMNFTIDFELSRKIMKEKFNFGTSVQMIFDFAQRQTDILLQPFYLFDFAVIDVDISIPYKDSGVCILSHRAGYETILFDVKMLGQNSSLVLQFVFCFTFIWLLFYVYNVSEKGTFSFDQLGKDFVNTVRNILSISLYNPPKRRSFRIYLAISIWCFFVLNFGLQAAIISFFSAYKRGKDVDSFEDVIEKGYHLEGLASPDMILPDTEPRFRIINSRIKQLMDIYECIYAMANDSRRFCLLDCANARYFEKNTLNSKGEQYLHLASKDRIHNYYLIMLFHRHSPLSARFNKYLRIFFEAGLISKWEQYRFTDIKEEFPVKALSMEDVIGIFKCYYVLLGFSSMIFMIEVTMRISNRVKTWSVKNIKFLNSNSLKDNVN